MSFEFMNRRHVLTSLFALVCAGPGLAQHADEGGSDHAAGQGRGASGGGGHSGGQHGRPEDPHSGEDDHGDDHGDDHSEGDADDHGDDHGSDHTSGGKGKGGPKYRGGKDTTFSGFGRGRSLEDRVLKVPEF